MLLHARTIPALDYIVASDSVGRHHLGIGGSIVVHRFVTIVICVSTLMYALACLPHTAAAAGWQLVSENEQSNIDTSAVVREPDGKLSVAYRDVSSTGLPQLRIRSYAGGTAAGVLSAPSTIVGPWETMTNPSLTLIPGGLLATFSGLDSRGAPIIGRSGEAYAATSSPAGAWTLVGPVSVDTSTYASDWIGAAIDSAGTPWLTWSGTRLHQSLDQAGVESNVAVSDTCCTYAANIARDSATGELKLIWYSNQTGMVGMWMRTVAPTVGPATRFKTATSDMSGRALVQAAAVARAGGGVYTTYCYTYPSCTKIAVSDGTKLVVVPVSAAVVPNSSEQINLSAGPDGRLWLYWGTSRGVYAMRSNTAASAFGAVNVVKLPAGADTTWSVNGDGALGSLDVVGNFNATMNGARRNSMWITRISPALSVAPRITARRGPRVVTATVQVRDAGQPVRGAMVVCGRARALTRTTGVAIVSWPASTARGARRCTVTAAGYAPAATSIVIPR